MPSIFTKNNGVTTAQFFEQKLASSNVYVGVGKPLAWGSGDSAILNPEDTINTRNQVFRDLIAIKKITSADCQVVAPRIDWTSGTTYVAYSQTGNLYAKTANTYTNKFYVRNSRDQVFKCLDSNNSVASTFEPVISVDGQLPENAYISTADGYKWKYLYTIPNGLKQKFFTRDYMPVIDDNLVVDSAVDGRIDVVQIIDGGEGYLSGANSSNAAILTVTGDGVGASLSARITEGVITGVNILDAGTDYTRATISISGSSTVAANLIPVIGPPGGHGANPAEELGASTLMVSVEFDGDEGNTIPTSSTVVSDTIDYRQVALIKGPKVSSGTEAAATRYRMTQIISVSGVPETQDFRVDELVYQGLTLADATFTGTVVTWDRPRNELHVANAYGTLQTAQSVIGSNTGIVTTAIDLTLPSIEPYTGSLLYIENRAKVIRAANQAEQIKLILDF